MLVIRYFAGLLLSALLAAASGVAVAHPYHESLTEIEWNSQRQMWEVAIRVLPEDLEDALQVRAGKRVDLIASDNIDDLILAYVNDHLQLRPAVTTAADTTRQDTEQSDTTPPAKDYRAQWVGKQVSHKAAWLYVQFAGPPPPVRLTNTLLFERHPRQINRVVHLIAGRRVAMDFLAINGNRAQILDVDLHP